MIQANVIAHVGPRRRGRGRRGRAAARQDRHDHARQPPGHGAHPGGRRAAAQALADAAQLASLADETPEGRSIVVLAKEKYGLRERDVTTLGARFVPFTAQTRMSGVDSGAPRSGKGAADAIEAYVKEKGGAVPHGAGGDGRGHRPEGRHAARGRRGQRVLGVIHLKDIVKGGIKERFGEPRRMGIKTVMITGDNPLTAAAIAAEAGVDDFLAQATPEAKLPLIREYQTGGGGSSP